MPAMLRHKETGELFIYTDALSKLDILELVVEDPVAAIVAEIAAEETPETLDADLDAALAAFDDTPKKKK